MKRKVMACCAFFTLLIGATLAQRYGDFAPPAQEPLHHSDPNLPEDSHHLVFLLQYLGNDYSRAVQEGRILDSLEYGEMQNFSRTLVQAYRPSSQSGKRTRAGLEQLEKHIAAKAELPIIRNLCARLVGQMAQERNLLLFPLTAPDLNLGKQLFQENCVSCHGQYGAGNGPAADTLNPKPRDLTDPAYLDFVSPFHLYQAVTLGISGTAMPAFGEAFSTEQSWSLAFHLMTLRRGFNPQKPKAKPTFTLQQLATQSNTELQRTLVLDPAAGTSSSYEKSSALDHFRSRLPELSMAERIEISKTKWLQSLACYHRGDSAQALANLVEGYMQGFELIEARLANKVYLRVERLVTEYRWCIEEKGSYQKAKAFVDEMLKILEEILKNPRMRRT